MRRVTVDLRAAGGDKPSGVRTYVRELTTRLVREKSIVWQLFWNSASTPPPDWVRALKGTKLLHTHYSNRLLNTALIFGGYPALDRVAPCDVFFMPDPRPVALRRAKLVTTFHDLSAVRYPECFSRRTRLWLGLLRLPHLARRSDALLSVSYATARELTDLWGVDSKRITVTHLGSDHLTKPTDVQVADVRKRYSLPKEFYLSLGTREPRKDLGLFIHSLTLAGASGIIAGPEDSRVFADAKEESADSESSLRYLGEVPESDKAALLAASRALVITSRYEGFCLPGIEALRAGTQVIARDIPVLHEILGEAAAFAATPEQFAALLRSGPRVPASLRTTQTAEYSWNRTARRTAHILARV